MYFPFAEALGISSKDMEESIKIEEKEIDGLFQRLCNQPGTGYMISWSSELRKKVAIIATNRRMSVKDTLNYLINTTESNRRNCLNIKVPIDTYDSSFRKIKQS